MKRPLVGLVVAFAAGILVGSWIGWPLPLWCVIAVALLGLFVFTRWPVILYAGVIATGAWCLQFSTANSAPHHVANLLDRRDQNIVLRGVVSDADIPFRLQLTAVNRSNVWETSTGTVLVFVSPAGPTNDWHYGDVLECSVILRVPPPARNPGTFDWQRWLAQKNIQFTGTIRQFDYAKILATDRGNPVLALSLKLRDRFARALQLGLEDQPRLAGVLAAMVLGERAEIPAETYADFQEAGVFHVFAISGLHVGIVTLVVLIVLRLVRVPRQWCGLIAIPLLVLFVFATGFRPGAIRALVMASVWLIGWMLVRPVDVLSSLATAALILLVWEPAQLFNGGFIMSFAVVIALVTLTPGAAWWKASFVPEPKPEKAERWWMSFLRPDPLIPRLLIPRWRSVVQKLAIWFVRLLICSWVSFIGLLPLMAVYFHLFTPVSVLANVIVIPLVGLIIPIGMLSGTIPALTLTLNNANFFLLQCMINTVDWLSRIPWGHCFVQAPPVWLTITYYALLFVWFSRQVPVALKRALAVAVVPVVLVVIVMARQDDSVELTVLDLHDGAAIFLNLPGEDHDWLIDGGTDWSGQRVVTPFLRAQGVDRLEAMVLTRADKAHAGGLTTVAQHIPVRQAIHAGTGSRSRFFWDWLETVRRQKLDIIALRRGDRRTIGGVELRVLNPAPGDNSSRSEDNSLVLLLEYGPTRVLLASDIGARVERQLTDVRAQILVKGRPSTGTSGTDGFLDAVQPELIIQTVNDRQSDRYVDPELRDRLRRRGLKCYRTDEVGAVTIRLTRHGYTVRTWVNAAASGPLRIQDH